VEETSSVGATVGRIVSRVGGGAVVGGILVEIAVAVESVTGAGVAVQAVRRNKKMAMNFFMGKDYMSLRGGAERRRSNLLLLGADF